MIQVHTGGLQTVIPLLIQCVTSILHTFSILSVSSMIEVLKLWYIALIDLVEDTGSYRWAANSYPPAYPGCHINTPDIFNLSVLSMIELFKTLINCFNWLSRWCRCIQVDCKQLFPCLSGVSHQYCTHFFVLSVPSMNEFFKTLINGLNWFSRWYRSIQTGCKHLSSWLSGVSHQYNTHFQFYHRHLWLNFEKLDIALIDY